MSIFSEIIDSFRAPCADRNKAKHLAKAKIALADAEMGVEDHIAHRDKLKARVARLEADICPVVRGRPARSSIQAANPGPSFNVPDVHPHNA
jgi:hypothetical protein